MVYLNNSGLDSSNPVEISQDYPVIDAHNNVTLNSGATEIGDGFGINEDSVNLGLSSAYSAGVRGGQGQSATRWRTTTGSDTVEASGSEPFGPCAIPDAGLSLETEEKDSNESILVHEVSIPDVIVFPSRAAMLKLEKLDSRQITVRFVLCRTLTIQNSGCANI